MFCLRIMKKSSTRLPKSILVGQRIMKIDYLSVYSSSSNSSVFICTFLPLNQDEKIPLCAIANNLTEEDITDEIANFKKGNEILSKNTQSKLNAFFGTITNKEFPSKSRKELLKKLDFAVDCHYFLAYVADNFEPATITPSSCNCSNKCATNEKCPCNKRWNYL